MYVSAKSKFFLYALRNLAINFCSPVSGLSPDDDDDDDACRNSSSVNVRGNNGKLAISSVSNESIVIAISSNRWEGRAPNMKKSSDSDLLLELVSLLLLVAVVASSADT